MIAIILVAVVSAVFSLVGDIGEAAQMSNAAVLIAFILVNASLLNMGRGAEATSQVASRFRIRGFSVIPVLGIGTSAVMLGYTSLVPILLAVALVGSGIIVGAFSDRFSGRAPGELNESDMAT